jgi:multiple sugar transport system ATP-binding protein
VAVLNRGLIQQVDTPQALYRQPANVFVASFIGSPPMNFVRGQLVDGKIELGDYRLNLPDGVRSRLRAQPPAVLVGLRPEEFEDARVDGQTTGATLPAEVEITEQLGPETYAYFRVPSLDVVEIGDRPIELAGALSARLDPRTSASPGQRLNLAVNLDGIQLFDPESGESLLSR